MPNLDTTLHLDMHAEGRRRRTLSSRVRQAINALLGRHDVYGLEWGDPDVLPPLRLVRDHFLIPYVAPDRTVLEIGPGGGRWPRYMRDAKRIIAVDYHEEILDELKKNIRWENITFVRNHGDDFPDIAPNSVDFVFSFGTFVHLDTDIIDHYLAALKPLLTIRADVVIQYADKTKPLAQSNPGFADNTPETMRALVQSHAYEIREEDDKTMWHSAIIRFGLPVNGDAAPDS